MKKADGGAGNVELPDEIFGIEPNVAVMHQVVTAQLAAKRAGTHSTKTRAEVRGGGAKPWRQKGTGRARQGSIRAPQWRGGGVAHGPHPRDYSQRTPKKMIRLAVRSALSDRASEGKVIVVDDWGITEPKHEGGRAAPRVARSAPRRSRRRRPAMGEAEVEPRRLPAQPARARGAVPHRGSRVEVAAQSRRARAGAAARGAQHLRRVAERLDRVLAGVARGDHRPSLRRCAPSADDESRDESTEVEAS